MKNLDTSKIRNASDSYSNSHVHDHCTCSLETSKNL